MLRRGPSGPVTLPPLVLLSKVFSPALEPGDPAALIGECLA